MPLFGLNGKTGGLVYYELNGKPVVRRAGKVSLKQYRQGENFAELRKHQSEFGMCSQYGKQIRESLGAYLPLFKDHSCSGRLTGALRKCVAEGEGIKGQRIFTQACLARLQGFAFARAYCFPSGFFRNPRLQKVKTGKSIVLSFSRGLLPEDMKSYTRLVLGIIILSGLHYRGKYELLHPDWHGRSFFQKTDLHAFTQAEEQQVQFEAREFIPEDVLVIGLAGLVDDKVTGMGWLVV